MYIDQLIGKKAKRISLGVIVFTNLTFWKQRSYQDIISSNVLLVYRSGITIIIN